MAEAVVVEIPNPAIIKTERKPINFTVRGEREVKVNCLIVLSQLESSLRAEHINVNLIAPMSGLRYLVIGMIGISLSRTSFFLANQ